MSVFSGVLHSVDSEYFDTAFNLDSAVDRSHRRVTHCFVEYNSRFIFSRSYTYMHSRNNSIHAKNPTGESRYEVNCTFEAAYLCVAYRDIGKGREQDAEAL